MSLLTYWSSTWTKHHLYLHVRHLSRGEWDGWAHTPDLDLVSIQSKVI